MNVVIPKIETQNKYQDAISMLEDGKYEAAIQAFDDLNGYKEAETYILEAKELMLAEKYNLGKKYLKDQKYAAARRIFVALGDYRDSKNMVESAEKEINSLVKEYLNEKKYTKAAEILEMVGWQKGD